ncbi:MAG: hypothetical protein IPJ69_14980 [Deltaproteobacteria bacterium]|nr:MAG: hypothetical protein IPJ69_14980 [Deltaproteobacteria bacterium]
MDQILDTWNKVSKPTKDGKRFITFKSVQDLMFLYATGFVDTQKYSFEQWLNAFTSSRQSNGSYLVSKEQWLEKKKYHYSGPVNPPFDPMTIEEKEYTEQEITKLLTQDLIPATSFDKSYVPQVINNLKAQGRLINGKFKIDQNVKKYLTEVIKQYPSPLRVLQVTVHKLLKAKKGDVASAKEELQKSSFFAGASAQQIASSRLSNMVGNAKTTAPIPEEGAGISLKDLRKKRLSTQKI